MFTYSKQFTYKHIPKFAFPFALVLVLFLTTCTEDIVIDTDPTLEAITKVAGFESVSPNHSGLNFINRLDPSKVKTIVNYINAYNGGGVALGDFNNDDLIDIYLTGNLDNNKLYLNKGNFTFEDATASSGTACAMKWSTGATVADVNNDGLLDIYVCHSYRDESEEVRSNSLFINQGNAKFEEQAKKYGIADAGYGITAAFFDYNKDGHLDLYVGNTPRHLNGDMFFIDPLVHYQHQSNPSELKWSDRLYKNNGDGSFSDVTKEAGLLNYGYMLGVSIADYNNDGWQDLYIAVDHAEPDYYLINNKDGTFTNKIHESFKHISLSSMGTDAADLNNDGHIDLLSLDMLSRDNYSEKTQMAPMNPKAFWASVEVGYHYQYMRNMLQLNNGDGSFSEIGQLAGVHKTDWSWSILSLDFNNDGWKDLFVSNGFYRAVMDKDKRKKFQEIIANSNEQRAMEASIKFPTMLQEQKNKNVFFLNNGNYKFTEVSKSIGTEKEDLSSGAAYADLDNDGDLDLVINRIDEPVSILKNLSSKNPNNNFLQIDLKNKNNRSTIGTKVKLIAGGQTQFHEQIYTRGYQSSMAGPVHFGLGKVQNIEKILVQWPDGNVQELNDIKGNQKIIIDYKKSELSSNHFQNNGQELFEEQILFSKVHKHIENDFDDYKKQVLLPHKMSQFGPFLCKGDVNQDGLEDVYVGGSNGQAGKVYLQENNSNKFTEIEIPVFEKDKMYEDGKACFFDADNDEDLDLYVSSGGNEFDENSELYEDRLYLNDGKGQFKRSKDIPSLKSSNSCVKAFDFDLDGDQDLFVASRHTPSKYPFPSDSYLLENNGGKFKIKTGATQETLSKLGMVSDAICVDVDKDNRLDLIVVGEWMPVTVLLNKESGFQNATEQYKLTDSNGWWNSIASSDLDNDGDLDFIIGNLGLNYKYKANAEEPFHIYAKDFDKNGKFDIVLGQFYQHELCPVRGRQCSSEQLPEIAEKFPSYHAFGQSNLQSVYGEQLNDAYHLEAKQFNSCILYNENGNLVLHPLPVEAQFSSVNGIAIGDYDKDGLEDILLGGNLYASEVETGRADASTGLVLINKKNKNFEAILGTECGIKIDKDVKDILQIGGKENTFIFVANNNEKLQTFELK